MSPLPDVILRPDVDSEGRIVPRLPTTSFKFGKPTFELSFLEVAPTNIMPHEEFQVTVRWKNDAPKHKLSAEYRISIEAVSDSGAQRFPIAIAIIPAGAIGQRDGRMSMWKARIPTPGEYAVRVTLSSWDPPQMATPGEIETGDRVPPTMHSVVSEKAISVGKLVTGFNMLQFAHEFSEPSWNEKDGTAIEYTRSDSNYRTYQPAVDFLADGGLHLYWKVDHIRGGDQDDHAVIDLVFDKYGYMQQAQVRVDIDGEDTPLTEVVDSFAVAAAMTGNPTVIAAEIAAKIGIGLYNAIVSMFEAGGRLMFPSVISENINNAQQAIVH